MIYTNIAAALGWENPEDLQEGLHLQPEEALTVDNALATITRAVENAERVTSELEAANTTITGLNNRINEMNIAATAAAEGATTSATRIQELEAQVAELGKGSSGSGSNLSVTTDEVLNEKPKSALPRFDDPEHPANQLADQYTGKRK